VADQSERFDDQTKNARRADIGGKQESFPHKPLARRRAATAGNPCYRRHTVSPMGQTSIARCSTRNNAKSYHRQSVMFGRKVYQLTTARHTFQSKPGSLLVSCCDIWLFGRCANNVVPYLHTVSVQYRMGNGGARSAYRTSPETFLGGAASRFCLRMQWLTYVSAGFRGCAAFAS
jgi:hypothetical protein